MAGPEEVPALLALGAVKMPASGAVEHSAAARAGGRGAAAAASAGALPTTAKLMLLLLLLLLPPPPPSPPLLHCASCSTVFTRLGGRAAAYSVMARKASSLCIMSVLLLEMVRRRGKT